MRTQSHFYRVNSPVSNSFACDIIFYMDLKFTYEKSIHFKRMTHGPREFLTIASQKSEI